jgi:hypothetical protein
MKDADAEKTFRCTRWHETDSNRVCRTVAALMPMTAVG